MLSLRLFQLLDLRSAGWVLSGSDFETRCWGTALWLLSKKFMKLYVGNLSFSTTEHEVRDLFEPYGTVTDVQVVTDRMSASFRGFAFVTMGNRNEGQAAIAALEGQPHDGRNSTVSEARAKTENRQNNSFPRRRR
jgi:RNA recognition motif-containing protein